MGIRPGASRGEVTGGQVDAVAVKVSGAKVKVSEYTSCNTGAVVATAARFVDEQINVGVELNVRPRCPGSLSLRPRGLFANDRKSYFLSCSFRKRHGLLKQEGFL